ncbi:hypothetical protein [Helicobacter pylori]|uniref:hypothetical protein n=1 Tax=Helicobacter pylori TaxID=210 RepID=UPI003133C1D6
MCTYISALKDGVFRASGIKYKIEDLQHDHYLSQVKEREEYYKNHVEEALKKDSECFEKGGDKVDCSAAMRIASGERNRRMLEIK